MPNVVGDEQVPIGELLGIRRIGDGQGQTKDFRAIRPDFDHLMALDHRDEQVTVWKGRIAVGFTVVACPGAAEAAGVKLLDDVVLLVKDKNSTIANIGDRHESIGPGISIIGSIQIAGSAARVATMSIRPHDLFGGVIDLRDHIIEFEIDQDRFPTWREKVSSAPSPGSSPG